MSRKIKLYGKLAEFVGFKEFDVEIKSVAQAVSFLINNFPHLESYMSPNYYQVKVGNYDIIEDEIHYPTGKDDIHFVPVITGAGRGFGKVLLGAALIGLSFISFGGAPGLGAAFKGGFTAAKFAKVGFISKGLAGLGTALVLQGVSEMLFPLPKPPKFESEEDPRLSFSFGGTQQTGRAGTPVPLVYGEIFTGSVVISGGVDTEQVQA